MGSLKKRSKSVSNRTDNENGWSRKRFLQTVGLSAAAVTGLSSCTNIPNSVESEDQPPLQIKPDPDPKNGKIWLGRGDVALMNSIHVYIRLEIAFSAHILSNPYDTIDDKERAIFTAIKEHDTAHRDFMAAVLNDSAVNDQQISFDFSEFNFSSRSDVLGAAVNFKNIGISMFNTFSSMMKRPSLFEALTKIASVEARHAAAIQFVRNPAKSFAPLNKGDGLDVYNNPRAAWYLFKDYVVEDFDTRSLPFVPEYEPVSYEI